MVIEIGQRVQSFQRVEKGEHFLNNLFCFAALSSSLFRKNIDDAVTLFD